MGAPDHTLTLRQCVTILVSTLLSLDVCSANHDARRLYDDLMNKYRYNKLVRPVANFSQALRVKFGLKFAQLHDVVFTHLLSPTVVKYCQKLSD